MSFISDIFKGGAEGILSGVSGVIKNFKADPTEVIKLESALAQAKLQLTVQLAQADAQAIAAVNATMQAEAKSEHWAQWLWRPVVGFTFSATIINNFILYSYFAKYGMTQIMIPGELWTAMLVVLGAAAATRGWEKQEKAKHNGAGV